MIFIYTKIKKLAAKGAWQDILAIHRLSNVMEKDVRAAPLVMIAALEAGDDTAVASLLAGAHAKPLPDAAALAMASKLLVWSKPDEAWALIKTIDPSVDPTKLSALCHRVQRHTTNPDIKAAAAELFGTVLQNPNAAADISQDDEPIAGRKGRVSPYQFVASGAGEETAPGTLDILESPTVDPIHKARNLDLWNRMEDKIAQKRQPKVMVYDDVLVNSLGQIWRASGEVIYNANRPLDTATYANAVHVERAVLASNATRGFYHWFAEHLPSLNWMLSAPQLDATVLFGAHSRSFQDETMALIGSRSPNFTRIPQVVHCAECYVPDIAIDRLAQWSYFSETYDLIRKNAALAAPYVAPSNIIYISRRDTERRVMSNEDRLEASLTELGVEVCLFSDMTLAEQIQKVQLAKMVIAPHGAGLTHLIAARPGLRVLEIMPSQTGSHSLRFNFARLSRVRGHHHTMWLEPVNPVTQSWSVNLAPFMRVVEAQMAKV